MSYLGPCRHRHLLLSVVLNLHAHGLVESCIYLSDGYVMRIYSHWGEPLVIFGFVGVIIPVWVVGHYSARFIIDGGSQVRAQIVSASPVSARFLPGVSEACAKSAYIISQSCVFPRRCVRPHPCEVSNSFCTAPCSRDIFCPERIEVVL